MARNFRVKKKKTESKERLEVVITDLGAGGDGIGHDGDVPVFVPMAMPGDRVSVEVQTSRRNGKSAEILHILEPSEQRRDGPCVHFGKCGGCTLQMLPKDAYKEWVYDRTVAAMAHHGFDSDVVKEPLITPEKTRRRLALKALKVNDKIILGFAQRSSHQLVDVQSCEIASSALTELFDPIRKLLVAVLPNRLQAIIHLTHAANGVDMVIEAALSLDLAAREAITDFANHHDIASIHMLNQGFLDPVLVRRQPVMHWAGCDVPLSPAAFIQASQFGENALVNAVVAAAKNTGEAGAKKSLDLFAGMGTFTFPLAQTSAVLAVEGAKSAVDDLLNGVSSASRQGAKLKTVKAAHRDLYRRPLMGKELEGFDLAVFDPPRAGAEAQAEKLAQSSIPTVVAVSCNPNTFSRDARILCDGGYELQSVLPVDQFLYSTHVELVGVFTKEIAE